MKPAPTLALGTAQWGGPYGISNRTGPPDLQQLRRMLDAAAAAGVVTLDTARAYGSEEVIGRVLGGSRDWRIISKLAPDLLEGSPSDAEVGRRAEASIAASLAHLQAERLDTVLVHRARHRDRRPVWETLRRWKDRGRVRAIGVSAESPALATEYLLDPEVEVLQVAASLFDRRLERQGFFAKARELGKEVFIRSVFLQGAPFLSPAELARRLPALATPVGALIAALGGTTRSLHEVLLVFARDHLGGSLVVGAETFEQLEENVRAWRSPPLDGPLEEVYHRQWDLPDEVLDPSLWPRS